MTQIRTTRFSGADWADQLHDIMLIGAGGIGSWLALSLGRIGHKLYVIDPDKVDETNVTGGQLYKYTHINSFKVHAVQAICREFGVSSQITAIPDFFTADSGMTNICITGLDNMAARRLAFEQWCKHVSEQDAEQRDKCLFMDGRLTIEMFEIFTLQGDKPELWEVYEKEHLFTDEEAAELDCTTKQSTFAAMGIGSFMTATLCNWATNQKLQIEFREVPFYQRQYMVNFSQKMADADGKDAAALTPTAALAVLEEVADAVLPGNTYPEATVLAAEAPKEFSESVQHLKSLYV